jgi:hypothetical protein
MTAARTLTATKTAISEARSVRKGAALLLGASMSPSSARGFFLLSQDRPSKINRFGSNNNSRIY